MAANVAQARSAIDKLLVVPMLSGGAPSVGYIFTIFRENGVEQPYGFVDARRTLSLMRLARCGELQCRISTIRDAETGALVTEAELEALVASGEGDG